MQKTILTSINTKIVHQIEVANMKKKIKKELSKELITLLYQKNLRELTQQVNRENIENVDKDQRTLLFHAILIEASDFVQELLEKGALVNIRDKNGWSPLHYAVQNGSVIVINKLIEFGADIEIKDDFGNTPLWRAVFASQGRGDIIKLLLSKKADINNINNVGISPLKLADTIANYNVKQFFS